MVGIHEAPKMCSIQGLPTQGTDVTILITRAHLHPLCLLVEFWGKFGQERAIDYQCLAQAIQSPGNAFNEFEGSPGDQCLAQVDGIWNRARIVSRNGSKYSVFLIDKGVTTCTTTSKLAWGKKEHFHLAPEVELCVLANVVPLSLDNRWSPVALEFLKSLSGKSVQAHVQDVLVPHRTFILLIPALSKQMYEMGFAKKVHPEMFQDFVLMSLKSSSEAPASPPTQQISVATGAPLHKQELFMVPEIPAGTVETVIVTEVTSPQRIFCQLKVFSKELKKLSEKITQCCEGRTISCPVGQEMIGFPCAARGSDGRWYRSVLQQVSPDNGLLEVLNIDYGTKQFVQLENVRPLAPEFFRMPVVTYICSLHGISDKGVGWTTSQIDFLRNLLWCKTVIAKFEYQSISEGVHYVTLYGDENSNINHLFGSKSCFLQCEKILGDYGIRSPAYSCKNPAQPERNHRKVLTCEQTEEEKEGNILAEKLPAENLTLNSSHLAVVQHVSDPSEFWIQTQNHTKELDELMDDIYHLYKGSENTDVVRNPTVGLYCGAKAEDGDFYRATVSEVGETQIKVFFVDYGNTAIIERINIRTLPDKFKKLPMLALKCTLAGVRPKDGRWSHMATESFIRAVTDKVFHVHVTAKCDESYVVRLTDPEAMEERDVGSLMCSSNFAEMAETQRQLKATMTTQPAILPPTQHPHFRFSAVDGNKGSSFQTQNTSGLAINEKAHVFKEYMFPIGSVLDVAVSNIESPNDFWCQLLQNAGHLKLIMRDIQARYAGSEFQPLVETACVARHPDNKLWYRALVIHKHETPHVDVLFVDYGQTETISLYDLRRICPEFLTLHGQAFRCSLLNPIDPTSAINEWNDEALSRFHKFADTAASNFVILKCTIYAVMYSEQKIVFNIVDLETPFESICTSLVNLVKSVPSTNVSGPSFRLDTYYYSTHNVKIGTEEQITVTCVNNVGQFYCQLEKNADAMEDLKSKVNNLCHLLEKVKLPAVFGTLCFAKYTDGHWYRGQIKASKPAILVHFVDYGDTIEVDKSNLLPVPREANDIISVPVQAVVCRLADVPPSVPSEANGWFERHATESKFRALIVAREPDGKLLVELYHRNTQINFKIKRMFQIEMQTEEHVVYQRAHETSAKLLQKPQNNVRKRLTEMDDRTPNEKIDFSAPKSAHQIRGETQPASTDLQPARPNGENGQRGKAAPLQLYKPPHQRRPFGRTPSDVGNVSEPAGGYVEQNLPTDTPQLITSSPLLGAHTRMESRVEKLPKLSGLPSQAIHPGMEADVYVSQCNSPFSFYLQLVAEEEEIFSIAEKLNDAILIPENGTISDAHPGDLVQAEFADDSSWYRAVVREIRGDSMALVEFIDFGNTALTPISKMRRLHHSFLLLPMYSTHCRLGGVASHKNAELLDPSVLLAFKEAVCGDEDKKLKCRFVGQSGSMWEVHLEDGGVNIIGKVLSSSTSTDGCEIVEVEEKPAQESETKQPRNAPALRYRQQEVFEEQQLQVFISTINDAHSFWCQCADTEELDKITLRVEEVGHAVDRKRINPGALSAGSPCIVLFSDDHLWYRAEVADKNGDELAVFFVDYGNKSRVNIADVREIPPDLVKIPPQAFLCELEGFDSSCGSWDSDAVDELSALTTDETLQLTITGIISDEIKVKYFVQMECDGHAINEVMKTRWKGSTTKKSALGEGEPTTSHELPPPRDSTVKDAALTQDQLEYSENQETDAAVAAIHLQRRDGEEPFTYKCVDPHRADEIKSTSRPKTSETPGNSFDLDSFAESPSGEHNQKSPERNTAVGLQNTEYIKEWNAVVLYQTQPTDMCDSGIEEPLSPPRAGPGFPILSCGKDLCETEECGEADPSLRDVVGPDDLNSPSDENIQEDVEKSEIPSTDLESSAAEVKTNSSGSSFDTPLYSGPTNRDGSMSTTARDSCLTRTTAVKMVSRKDVRFMESIGLHRPTDAISPDSEQIQTDLVLASPVLPGQQLCDPPIEQDIEAGRCGPQVPCVGTHVEIDLMTEDEPMAQCEEDFSTLLAEMDIATSQPKTCDVAFTDEMVGKVEEVACLTDVCTDPGEPQGGSKVSGGREVDIVSVAAEEMVICTTDNSVTEDETTDSPSDLPCDTKPLYCPYMTNLVEELICPVGESFLTDVRRDQCQQTEAEEIEQLVHTPPKQEEDCDGSRLSEKTLSSADESFEGQLSKITHLSLIIYDGSDGDLPVTQHPE